MPKVAIEANTSFWMTLHEEVQNGLRQPGSDDEAADTASGFNFKQGRVALAFESPEGRVEGLVRLRLEERTDIIDFWGAYHVAQWLSLAIGQMKIPSTAEVLARDHLIDFISRTTFGQNVGNYALSRTPYISPTSSLMGVNSHNRDLGLSARGSCPVGEDLVFRYFLMIGNGIGANNYVGGRESEEFLFTNRFGDFYYGLRLEARLFDRLTLGVHGSLNRHEDVAFDARGPVVDFERTVWTADLALALPWGIRLAGFYGDGEMDDFDTAPYRFDYSGWGLWALRGFFDGALEVGLRFDRFTTEFQSDGVETMQDNWTFGANYRPIEYVRLQLNYLYKETENPFEGDIDDNILYLNVQFLFERLLVE